MKPRVEMIVSETHLTQIRNDLNSGNKFAYLIGGAYFKTFTTHMLTDEPADTITWEEVASDAVVETAQERVPESVLAANEKIEDMADSESSWFFRRRRSAPPPPPPYVFLPFRLPFY